MISGSLFFYQNWLTFLLALWLSFLLTKALIAFKNCVLSAFRQNNAPQLRLYQNWGANMANHSINDSMQPLEVSVSLQGCRFVP